MMDWKYELKNTLEYLVVYYMLFLQKAWSMRGEKLLQKNANLSESLTFSFVALPKLVDYNS